MWLKIHDTLLGSPKVRAFARDLGINIIQARGYLVTFWLNCLRSAPDGHLENWVEEDYQYHFECFGDKLEFKKTLIKHGFLDGVEDGYQIHDYETQELQRAKDRQRKRLERQRKKQLQLDLEEKKSVPGQDRTCHRIEKQPQKANIDEARKANFGSEKTYDKNVIAVKEEQPKPPVIKGETEYPKTSDLSCDVTPERRGEERRSKTLCAEQKKPHIGSGIKIPLKNGGEHEIPTDYIRELANNLERDQIDIIKGLKEARQWNLDNPSKRKTKRGINKHLTYFVKGYLKRNPKGYTPAYHRMLDPDFDLIANSKAVQAYLDEEERKNALKPKIPPPKEVIEAFARLGVMV